MRIYAQKLMARKVLAAKKNHSVIAGMPHMHDQELLATAQATNMTPTQLRNKVGIFHQ